MTKIELQEKVSRLRDQNTELRRAIGLIRKKMGDVEFPGDHRPTVDKLVRVVDRVMQGLS